MTKIDLIDGVIGKTCFRCRCFKAVTEFQKDSSKRLGIDSSCKMCLAEDRKKARNKHYAEHSDTIKQKAMDFKNKNYEKIAIKRREKNAEQVIKLDQRYIEKLLKLPKKHITPELIDLKTQAIQIKRISKDISTTLKKGNS